jgi:hypothetical protein
MVGLFAQMDFFREIRMLLQFMQIGYLEQNECFYPLKTLISKQYSFQKLTEFSQGNKVLDAPNSNIDAFV